MELRPAITVLVYTLPVLIVAFGVLMGGYALSQATQDLAGARVLWRVAMACLMLLALDLVLLVGALGVRALTESHGTDVDQRKKDQ